jgi:hypothetical protein
VTVPCAEYVDYFLAQEGAQGDDEPLCVFDRVALVPDGPK